MFKCYNEGGKKIIKNMMCYNGKSKIDIYVKDKWKKVEIIKIYKN